LACRLAQQVVPEPQVIAILGEQIRAHRLLHTRHQRGWRTLQDRR
jgi:hypothetical protein